MINASKEFKEKLKNGTSVVNYADVTLSDGTVLHLGPKDFMIGGCEIEDKAADGKFGIGFVIGKTLKLRIANHDEQYSRYDFYCAAIRLYVALTLDNGTIEKIRKGVYYVTVPQTPGDIIEVSAVDGMFKLDRDYSSSTTRYPANLSTILTDACISCGIPVGFQQFDNMNFMVAEKPEKTTYRQVVSYACQIAGYNARIDNAGYMQLVWLDSDLLDFNNYNGGNFKTYPHDSVVDGGNFKNYNTDLIISGNNYLDKQPEHILHIKSLSVHTDDVTITGVKVVEKSGENEKEYLSGKEGYLIEIRDNPFVSGKGKAVADYLWARISGIEFRPFSAQILNNPLYEPLDIVKISDRKGNVYSSIINSVTYTIGSYTQISCETEDPIKNGSTYVSASAQAVVAARKNAEIQLSAYDKAVQNMNQIAMNAMGFHTTYEDQEDGSRITYLHDKPELEESKIIYKQSIDGFFVSQDGGKSYTAGFDSQGNAVVNILYAIGIVADWIRTGRFSVQDEKGNILFLADINTDFVEIGGFIVNKTALYNGPDSLNSDIPGVYVGSDGIKSVGSNTDFTWIIDGQVTSSYIDTKDIYAESAEIKKIYFGGSVGAVVHYADSDGNIICRTLNITGDSTGSNSIIKQKVFSGHLDEVQFRMAGNNPAGGAYSIVAYKDEKALWYIDLFNSDGNTSFHNNLTANNLYSRIYSNSNNDDASKSHVICTVPSADNLYCNYINTNSGTPYSINVNGGWGSSSPATHKISTSSSDIRLKTNISNTAECALDIINQIQMRQFDWLEDGTHQKIGFIADELEEIDSHFAFGGGYDADGSMDVKSVDTFYLLGYVVKAEQELHDEITELKKENEALKDANNELLERMGKLEKTVERMGENGN